MGEQAFSDVKILDLTWHIAGPYCTKMFADFGGDVIKVERPGGGDPARTMGPFLNDEPHPEKSAPFSNLNTNKLGITLNLKCPTGKKILKELVKDVDILVESFSPGVMDGLGLDYGTLNKINPRLVMTSISNFGQTGPYRDYKMSDLVLSAMGSETYSVGILDNPPEKRVANVILYQGGLVAALATFGALFVSRQQGLGQYVDVSLFETQAGDIASKTWNLSGYAYSGCLFGRGEIRRGLSVLPWGTVPCKDGYIRILSQAGLQDRFARLMDMPEFVNHPRLQGLEIFNMEGKGEIDAIFMNWCEDKTKREIMEKAQAEHIPCTQISTPKDVVDDPHFNYRGVFVEIEHPVTGRQKYPGAPFKSPETPWVIKRPAPLLGQHNVEIYCDRLGYTKQNLVDLRRTGII